MRSSIRMLLSAALAPAIGCAAVQTPGGPALPPRASNAGLTLGAMSERTAFETSPESGDDQRDHGRAKPTPVLFWTGVVLASVGAVGTIGFGTAGKVAERKIDDGYEDGFTAERRDELESRGETWNALAITSATVGLVGLALAATVYGIDYTRCGPLAPAKRRCPARE